MPKQTEAERLAERRRVDEFMRKKQRQRSAAKPKPKPKTPKERHSEAAKKRREAITKKTAPSGFKSLLSALGLDL